MRTVEELVVKLPPEDRARLVKMATESRKTVEELVVFILSQGVSTRAKRIFLAGITSGGIANIF